MDLLAQSAVELRRRLARGDVSSLELLDTLEARISDADQVVNALPTLCFERARKKAESVSPDTPLAGLPVAIKDLNDVSGVRTTYGCQLYADHVPETSDILVERLERMGGIVYAKANTPEFGTGANTVNAVLGATRNPWNTNMSAAGSSGGSAAALASGTAWLATGSDMGGSLRNPASFCGIVGMRPTVGYVASNPSSGVIDTLSTNGPMARNVRDLGLLFDAMSGHEPMDPLSLPDSPESFLAAAGRPMLPDRVAFSMDLGFTPVDPRTRAVLEAAAAKLSAAGVEIVETTPDFSGLNDIFHVLRAHSYASGLGDLAEQHGDQLNHNVLWNIREGQKLSTRDIIRAEMERLKLVQRVQTFFQEFPILLCPATVVPPYPVTDDHVAECDGHVFDNYYQWLAVGYAFTVGICPALSLPCGLTTDGLPVGLQIAGASYEDARVISAAARIEEILCLDTTTPIDPRTP